MSKLKKDKIQPVEFNYVIAKERPCWIDDDFTLEKMRENEFARIRVFFHDNTPDQKSSARAITLEQYGWADKNKLQKILLDGFKKTHANYPESLKKMNVKLADVGLEKENWYETTSEKICLCTSGKKKIDKLFSHLRNVFAHSRFSIRSIEGKTDFIFIFEDAYTRKLKNDKGIGQNEFDVSARMILKKTTLLKWIEIIESGERAFARQVSLCEK